MSKKRKSEAHVPIPLVMSQQRVDALSQEDLLNRAQILKAEMLKVMRLLMRSDRNFLECEVCRGTGFVSGRIFVN